MNTAAGGLRGEVKVATPGSAERPVVLPPAPRHVAIIMDGNGRWATRRGLPRAEGHRRGVEAVRQAVRFAGRRGIRILTLFSFSSENWSRPQEEISHLLRLMKIFIASDLAELKANNVRIRVIGDRENVPPDVAELIDRAEQETSVNTGLLLVVAFNYGGREEIVRAVRGIAERVAAGALGPEAIDEATVSAFLDTGEWPDPDLVIRTSGEQRVSNFLLWQSAYAEYAFLPILWPDFDDEAFASAIADYERRERRFGGVSGG